MIDFEKAKKSLQLLEEQFFNHQRSKNRTELTEMDREAIAESVIQRYETCYDAIWKDLKRYLVEELGLADVPNSPKPIFRLAAQNRLLPSPVQQWLEYADARTATAHDYSGTKAEQTLVIVRPFIDDATRLLQTMIRPASK